jgi:hypothetical protein
LTDCDKLRSTSSAGNTKYRHMLAESLFCCCCRLLSCSCAGCCRVCPLQFQVGIAERKPETYWREPETIAQVKETT